MRNTALINLLGSNRSPFVFDDLFAREPYYSAHKEYTETDEGFFASIDMPGVNSSDIKLDVSEKELRVTAERTITKASGEKATRKYDYLLSLPQSVDAEKISVHYENGVLDFALPKKVDKKVERKIEITTGEKPKSWLGFKTTPSESQSVNETTMN